VQAAVSGVGPSAPPAFRARGGAQVVQRQVIQMDDEDAREYIAANRIEWQGKVSKKKVEEYYNNTHNNEEHRRGLLAAWNRNAGKGQRIAEVAEEEQRRGMLAQKEKKDRETANKLQGDKLLPAALDTYQTRKLQGVAEISGFRICRHKRGLAVALSRATGKAESKAMKGTRQIERIAYADTYKWFSESQAHTEKFVNYTSGDTGATLAVWLEADRYIYIRQALEHEFLSSGAKVNRFHQENVSGHMMHLINIGIHPDKDAEFMAAVIDVKDLSTAAAEESFGVSVPTPQSAVASSPTTSGVDEEMQFAYLAGYSKNSFKQWRKSNQYLWYQDEAETFGSPIPPYCSQRLTARITRWRETGID